MTHEQFFRMQLVKLIGVLYKSKQQKNRQRKYEKKNERNDEYVEIVKEYRSDSLGVCVHVPTI